MMTAAAPFLAASSESQYARLGLNVRLVFLTLALAFGIYSYVQRRIEYQVRL